MVLVDFPGAGGLGGRHCEAGQLLLLQLLSKVLREEEGSLRRRQRRGGTLAGGEVGQWTRVDREVWAIGRLVDTIKNMTT